MANGKSARRFVQTVAKNSSAFQRGFLRAQMVCCKVTLMTTCFATTVINTSLIRFWNGPDLLGLYMVVDLSVIRIFRLKLY